MHVLQMYCVKFFRMLKLYGQRFDFHIALGEFQVNSHDTARAKNPIELEN